MKFDLTPAAVSKKTKRSLPILTLVFSALAFLGAAVMIFTELVEKQQVILSTVKEDALWAAYQLDRETLKLINSLKLFEDVQSDEHLLNEAKNRFDMLYSRVNILANGQLKKEFINLPDGQKTLVFLHEKLEEMDALLFVEDQYPDIKLVLDNANIFLKRSESFVLGVLAFRSKERVESRAETLKLFLSLGLFLALLTLTMSVIIFLLFKQVKISRDSYKRAKVLTVELKSAVKSAELASTVKSNFLATMSHEIRTPMNAIIGLTHLVIDSDIDSKQKKQLEKIQKSTENLLSIINDILDFTKIESGKMSFEEVSYSLDDALDYIYYLNKDIAASKGLKFTISRDFSIDNFLIGDKVRLQQILINLVSNAVKFTFSGFVEVNVRKEGEDFLTFEVKDSGIGITEDADVFDAFTQADASTTRLYGGTGLGLSITKKLVELLDGEIRYETEEGKGTCFYMRLPFKPDSAAIIPANNEPFFLIEDDQSAISLFESLNIDTKNTVKLDDAINKENSPIIISDEWLNTIEGEVLKSFPPYFYDKSLIIGMDSAISNRCLVTSLLTPKQLSEKLKLIKNIDRNKVEKKSVLSYLNENQSMSGKKVLLAEDNKINADIAKALLERMSISVDWVENGQQAFENAISKNYDLILMDIRMPVMDGYEASKKIQTALENKKPPIIALTADAFTMDNTLASGQGIDDLLAKPIDPALMLSKLESWMLDQKSAAVASDFIDQESLLFLKNNFDKMLAELDILEGMLMNGDAESEGMVENIVAKFSSFKDIGLLRKVASNILLYDYDDALSEVQSFKSLVTKYANMDGKLL